MTEQPTIHYTKTDEAPMLATASLLPIVRGFAGAGGVKIHLDDISLAGRILAAFADQIDDSDRTIDALAQLGEMAKTPSANIIKLPNISASIPQLNAAIAELQSNGFAVPDFPDEPKSDEEKKIRAAYAGVLGSAVNPVLREGNSDRRVAAPVKQYAQKNPHSMGVWSSESKTEVLSMSEGDFYGNEQSHVMKAAGHVSIVHTDAQGDRTTLKETVELLEGEVIDASVMNREALRKFLTGAIQRASDQGVLFSLHMKATMMKVSDPIIFGHAVEVYFAEVFEKHADALEQAGVDSSKGIGDLYGKLDSMEPSTAEAIQADLEAVYEKQPSLAMVDSDRGITNLHVPSDVIIDASMPAMIRSSGQMWGPDGKTADTIAIIPDRSYSGVYQTVIDDCKKHGAFDVATMGNVSNVGLMAKKAEEYGSHDKTFKIPSDGKVEVVDSSGEVLLSHIVCVGDIWRMCQTKDVAIKDWVKLAVTRARATGNPAVFWLSEERAHDANLISKVNHYLKDHNTEGIDVHIMSPVDATQFSCDRMRDGKDTISVTGNVLRDYLTDLFPILELGTSAKMLSIVPLLAGGGLFETGAGGSAPKHVQQLVEENHLRWDSLGEFLAIAVSLEDLAEKSDRPAVGVIANALTAATGKILDENRSPSRKVDELDNRGSHFYLALYWAEALASQTEDSELAKRFQPVLESLQNQSESILKELIDVQGQSVDLGGYYDPDPAKVDAVMRPSSAFNEIIDSLSI
ncbi:MAG: NADP-dependent isocitrate dehydrogenase [Planctomycetota bacterium]